MKIFELHWTPCPTSYNQQRVARVEANTDNDAKILLADKIKGSGIAWFDIQSCHEYQKPTAAGRVLNLE